MFLVLIPKFKGWMELKDFRPIILIRSLYKLLAKVLVNILKRVMNMLVNKAHSRKILDASLIENEIIDSIVKRKDSEVLRKLDIEKAYDYIKSFHLKVLEKMGFGKKLVNWINWCISTSTFFVLVNGSPTGFFKSSRGSARGTPSPLTSLS